MRVPGHTLLPVYFRANLFAGLLTHAATERQAALGKICAVVTTWASAAQALLADDTSDAAEETRRVLPYHVLVMLRMSRNCPFDDVRARFSALLAQLANEGVDVPQPVHDSPSYFIPAAQVLQFDTQDEYAIRAACQCFVENGRFSNAYRLMAYFPVYMEKVTRSFNQILRHQAPLPRTWRNYIAIMAAAQHQCQYLVSLQTTEFLLNGGDAQWLQGLKYAPPKIQKLARLNTFMAHQPWRIKKTFIEAIVKGVDSWSMSELVQAIVVMATFHSLCSFVLGCGVVNEIDMPGGTVTNEQELTPEASPEKRPASPTQLLDASLNVPDTEGIVYTEQLLSRLKAHAIVDDIVDEQTQVKEQVFAECTNKETFDVPSKTASTTMTSPEALSRSETVSSPATEMSHEVPLNFVYEDLSRFLSDDEVKHVDFDVKSNEYSIFRLQDYNWEDHGCSLISTYLSETAELLDEEFNAILNLTEYSLFTEQQEVDTWPFRQAIWYYVFRLAGMSHDDYNYHEVNIYLNKRIKQYIKKVACYPELIVPSDFHRMGFSFRPDEKCQINLLTSEARKCTELLYALHAVMEYDESG